MTVSLEEAQHLVMTARVMLGWVDPTELEVRGRGRRRRGGRGLRASGLKMTRGGQQRRPGDGPERRCIVTGESQPKGGLIRFVVGPDAQVVPDILGRLPGRGFYVAADRAAIEKAATKGLFARAARQPVTVPDGLG